MNEVLAGRACRIVGRAVWLGLVILIQVYFFPSAAAKAAHARPGHVVDKVVDNWIAVAQTQCDRRLYAQAEDSLLRIQQYRQYFSEQQKRKINELVEGIQRATSERTRLLQNVDSAGRLIEEGEFLKARAYLHEAVKSIVLSDQERNRVKLTLQRVEAKVDEQKRLMADLYKRSRREYKLGNFEEARQGFAIVASSGLYVPGIGKTAEEYLADIEQGSNEYKAGSGHDKKDADNKTDIDSNYTVVVPPEQQTQQTKKINPQVFHDGYGSERLGNQAQQNSKDEDGIKQSYLKAIIRDTQTKVTGHIGKAEFSYARAVVQNAQNTLQKYRADIDQELYRQHEERLQELLRIIDEQQMHWELRWDTKDSGL